MDLHEMIYKRKSFRRYRPEPVDAATLRKIGDFCAGMKPLYPEIKVRSEIIGKEKVKCILPWITPQVIAIFSEEKEGYLENVGFLYQQLDLYLQAIGLGSCWLGMGRLDKGAVVGQNDGLGFVIMLAVGNPKDGLRSDVSQFRRKALSEIADRADERLEPARLAPSSVNSQPWYFTHEDAAIHAYCSKQGLLKKSLGDMNRIDMGIALAHLYVANPDCFRFFKAKAEEIKDHAYIGSFSIK